MLALLESTGDEIDFHFLSHEHLSIQRRIGDRGLPDPPVLMHCDKTELPAAYQRADFGLVLRDDSAVNRVSCPTKLVEYLLFGLIPVVRSPRLGDFHEMDFAYITEDEFRDGFVPDAATREWMAEHNLDIVRRLVERFRSGASRLREMLSSHASAPR